MIHLPAEIWSALNGFLGALVGGVVSLTSTRTVLRHELENARKEREAKYRQEYAAALYAEKLARYSSFLSGYQSFTAAVRVSGPLSPQAMEALGAFMDTLSSVSLSAGPDVENLSVTLLNMATQYAEGRISAQELGRQYLSLVEAMKRELSLLKEALPGYFQLKDRNVERSGAEDIETDRANEGSD